jgi:glycosyltransferase involved in cell wall biosynthesis
MRVTVIIATYNRSDLLPYSIGSALRQTFTDFEVLVVGDGCTDDSERVVAKINEPRVRWINLPANSGHQSAPNNEGIRQARGEIIAYLGHDDLWLPHHLQAHVDALDADRADLASSLCTIVGPDGSVWPAIPSAKYGWFSPPMAITHRRRVITNVGGWKDYRDINQSRDVSPDGELWRRVRAADTKQTFIHRMTGIKFPGSLRRDVYRKRSNEEQRMWLERIDREPDLETKLLVDVITGERFFNAVPFRHVVRLFATDAVRRVRRRLQFASFAFRRRRSGPMDDVRAFKGL